MHTTRRLIKTIWTVIGAITSIIYGVVTAGTGATLGVAFWTGLVYSARKEKH